MLHLVCAWGEVTVGSANILRSKIGTSGPRQNSCKTIFVYTINKGCTCTLLCHGREATILSVKVKISQ